jgi:hypothetical protein
MKYLSQILLLILLTHTADARVFVIDNSVRATYEELTLPGNEQLGLLGINYLIDHNFNDRASFYYGLGVYSAVSGIRGGFFTGGAEAGLQYRIGKLVLDGGLFVGGGGGGSAPQGGGLMIRPHVGAMIDFGKVRLGLHYTRVKFPNGNIDSDQIGLVAEFPFQGVFADAVPHDIAKQNLEMVSIYIAPTLQHYSPTRSAVLATGVQSMDLAGIELGRFMTGNSFFFLEAAAAARGNADGYAELLGGLGYRYSFSDRFLLQLKVAAGAGGGGAVDTGGGAIYKASLGAEVRLGNRMAIGLDYGIVDAMDGTFKADMVRLSLRYGLQTAVVSGKQGIHDSSGVSLGKWELGLSHMTYLDDPSLRKNPAISGNVNLVALKLNRELTDHIYVSGYAAAAYQGSAGGYATGLIGLGYKRPLSDRLGLRAELLVGPGGGGGLNTNGGGVYQPMIGLTYRLSKNIDFSIMAGKIGSFKGNLGTEVVDIGLIYRFNTLESR